VRGGGHKRSFTQSQLQQEVKGQIRWPAALPQGKNPGLRCKRGCVNPRYCLDDLEQSVLLLSGFKPQNCQPVSQSSYRLRYHESPRYF